MSVASFVNQLYVKFLNRSADKDGSQYWINQIENGVINASEVTKLFIDSNEFSEMVTPIAKLYYTIFGRQPDVNGLFYWVNLHQNGRSLSDISHSFIISQEFTDIYGSAPNPTDFLGLLYQSTFNRAADKVEEKFWLNAIEKGMSYSEVIRSFASSEELNISKDEEIKILAQYHGILSSKPTKEELAQSLIDNDPISLITKLYNSEDYSGESVPGLSTKGVVIDGYIKGATVFLDTNNNGVLDIEETSVVTDDYGNFNFGSNAELSDLVIFGGTDISTGLAFEGAMTAEAGSLVVTPLTTLIDEVQASLGINKYEAHTLVKNNLNLTGDGINLFTYDPIYEANKAGAPQADIDKALSVQTTSIQIMNIIAMERYLNQLEGSDITGKAVPSIYAEIATDIAEGPVDYSSKKNISEALEKFSDNPGFDQLTQIVANINTFNSTSNSPKSQLNELASAQENMSFIITELSKPNGASQIDQLVISSRGNKTSVPKESNDPIQTNEYSDLALNKIDVSGIKQVGSKVTLSVEVENIGTKDWVTEYLQENDDFKVLFFVDDEFVGDSGWNNFNINAGSSDTFNFDWRIDKEGEVNVSAKIFFNTNATPDDIDSNNSIEQAFIFNDNKYIKSKNGNESFNIGESTGINLTDLYALDNSSYLDGPLEHFDYEDIGLSQPSNDEDIEYFVSVDGNGGHLEYLGRDITTQFGFDGTDDIIFSLNYLSGWDGIPDLRLLRYVADTNNTSATVSIAAINKVTGEDARANILFNTVDNQVSTIQTYDEIIIILDNVEYLIPVLHPTIDSQSTTFSEKLIDSFYVKVKDSLNNWVIQDVDQGVLADLYSSSYAAGYVKVYDSLMDGTNIEFSKIQGALSLVGSLANVSESLAYWKSYVSIADATLSIADAKQGNVIDNALNAGKAAVDVMFNAVEASQSSVILQQAYAFLISTETTLRLAGSGTQLLYNQSNIPVIDFEKLKETTILIAKANDYYQGAINLISFADIDYSGNVTSDIIDLALQGVADLSATGYSLAVGIIKHKMNIFTTLLDINNNISNGVNNDLNYLKLFESFKSSITDPFLSTYDIIHGTQDVVTTFDHAATAIDFVFTAVNIWNRGTDISERQAEFLEYSADYDINDISHPYTQKLSEYFYEIALDSNTNVDHIISELFQTAVISNVFENMGVTGNVLTGGGTDDTSPLLIGTLSARLGNTEVLNILRNGVVVGQAVVDASDLNRLSWSYQDENLVDGISYDYQVRVQDGVANFGPLSNTYNININASNPEQIGVIESVTDNLEPIKRALFSGDSTNDLAPQLNGSLRAPLNPDQDLEVLRDGKVIGKAIIDPKNPKKWIFLDNGITDPLEESETYQYSVQVNDGTNISEQSNVFVLSIDTSAPDAPIVDLDASSDTFLDLFGTTSGSKSDNKTLEKQVAFSGQVDASEAGTVIVYYGYATQAQAELGILSDTGQVRELLEGQASDLTYSQNNKFVLGSAVVEDDGSWIMKMEDSENNPSLSAENHVIGGNLVTQYFIHVSAIMTDTAGNVSDESSELDIMIETKTRNEFTADPLILDLNNDGIHTSSIFNGMVFDHDGDGDKENTGWASEQDGILVLDLNNDGIINDGFELFGDQTIIKSTQHKAVDGYEALAQYDQNADGIIDVNDAIFEDLNVWIDADQDGQTDTDELRSLSNLAISEISLRTTQVEILDQGNTFIKKSGFVQNAVEKEMADVAFATGTRGADISYIEVINKHQSIESDLVMSSVLQLKVTLPPQVYNNEYLVVSVNGPAGSSNILHKIIESDHTNGYVVVDVEEANLQDKDVFVDGEYSLSLMVANEYGATSTFDGSTSFVIDKNRELSSQKSDDDQETLTTLGHDSLNIETGLGSDHLDFSFYLTGKTSSDGSTDAEVDIAITLTSNAIDTSTLLAPNEVIVLSGLSDFEPDQSFQNLNAADLLLAISNSGTVAYGNISAGIDVAAPPVDFVGNTTKNIALIENPLNLGEYKVFEIASDGTEFSSVNLVGFVDFGASLGTSIA